jgi:threonine dehydrogenase-like Zn-dependent dehydrogenase
VLAAIFLASAASAAAGEARVKVALLDGAPVYHWRVFTSRYSDDIDRALVLREFKRQGFTLPNHFVEEAVQHEITEKYQGSKTSLGQRLQRSGVSLQDYTREDFTRGNQRYDVIFDNVNNHSFSDRQRVLTPNGICILAGIGGAGLHPEAWGRIAGIFKAGLLSRFVRQKFVSYGTKTNKEDLKFLSELMRTGKVTPVIDRTYKLSETAEAMRYFEEGHARGKVVITIE